MSCSGRWLGWVVALGALAATGGCGSSSSNGGQGGSGGAHGVGGRAGAGEGGGRAGAAGGGGAGIGGAGQSGGGAGNGGAAEKGGAAGTGGAAGSGGAAGGSASGGALGSGASGGAAGSGATATGGGGIATGGAGVGGSTGGTGVGGSTGGSPGTSCVVPSAAGVWTEIAAPSGDAGLAITDSFALGADDLMFAGTTAPGASGNQLRVVHFSHGCWTQELSMPIDASAMTASVHGTGPGDLWAVGGALILHGNGQSWTPFDTSWQGKIKLTPRKFNAPALPTLVRVRAVASGDVWFNEVENVVHWAGGAWTGYNFDSPDYPNTAAIAFDFHDIWIDSPNSIWVTQGSDQVGNTYDPAFINHFDGANWRPVNVGNYDVYAIWRSGTTLWLAAAPQPPIGNGLIPYLAGSATFAEPVAVRGVPANIDQPVFQAMWGRSASDIWSAGSDVAHFDGTGWSLETDVPASAHSSIGASNNTFVGGDPNAVWLITPGPRFFRKPFGP
jgi:hypothetical protein